MTRRIVVWMAFALAGLAAPGTALAGTGLQRFQGESGYCGPAKEHGSFKGEKRGGPPEQSVAQKQEASNSVGQSASSYSKQMGPANLSTPVSFASTHPCGCFGGKVEQTNSSTSRSEAENTDAASQAIRQNAHGGKRS